MLEVKDLRKNYGDVAALRGVTLSLGGGFTAVTGRSGSGKSTFLKAAGLMIPAEGEIFIGGRQVSALSEREKTCCATARSASSFRTTPSNPPTPCAKTSSCPCSSRA